MAEEWSVGNPRPVMHKYRMQKQCLFVPFHSDPYILLVVFPYFLFPRHSSSYHRPLCWQSTNDKRDGPLLRTSSWRVMIPAMQHVQFVVPCPRTSNTPLCYEIKCCEDTSFQTASLASTRWWLLPSASLSTMFQALAHVLREAERLVGSLPSGRPTACAALCCTVCDIGSKMILHKYPIQFWEHYHLSSHAATCWEERLVPESGRVQSFERLCMLALVFGGLTQSAETCTFLWTRRHAYPALEQWLSSELYSQRPTLGMSLMTVVHDSCTFTHAGSSGKLGLCLSTFHVYALLIFYNRGTNETDLNQFDALDRVCIIDWI